jgi:3'(2'), 5'-bisphosphate nucleotidase
VAEEQFVLDSLVSIAREAGKAILEIYESDFEIIEKSDGSPLTLADKNANAIIERGLKALEPKLPIVSEESERPDATVRNEWRRYWLVDPLDGTKEFTKRNGEFTVNIALIEEGVPVIGVVHVPVSATTYFASNSRGAFKQCADQEPEPIRTSSYKGGKVIVVASRSHANPLLVEFFNQLDEYETLSMGSSLKLCLVAEGRADIYPRFGPTSEWDTAAAHCIVNAAGGQVTDMEGAVLQYNKPDILNPWFVVTGAGDYPWLQKLQHVRDHAIGK